MKRQQKPPGCLITWTAHWGLKPGDFASVRVAIKGVDGYYDLPWDRSDPMGGHHAAAKTIAQSRGFDDVKETGVLEMGSGFIFEPVLFPRRENE